jgi:hypothetical protein
MSVGWVTLLIVGFIALHFIMHRGHGSHGRGGHGGHGSQGGGCCGGGHPDDTEEEETEMGWDEERAHRH